jgi:hypothetical protein
MNKVKLILRIILVILCIYPIGLLILISWCVGFFVALSCLFNMLKNVPDEFYLGNELSMGCIFGVFFLVWHYIKTGEMI